MVAEKVCDITAEIESRRSATVIKATAATEEEYFEEEVVQLLPGT